MIDHHLQMCFQQLDFVHLLEIHLRAIFWGLRDQQRRASAVWLPTVCRYGYSKSLKELLRRDGKGRSFLKLVFEEGVVWL